MLHENEVNAESFDIEQFRRELTREVPAFVRQQTSKLKNYKGIPGYTEKELFDLRGDVKRIPPIELQSFWNTFVPAAIQSLTEASIQSKLSENKIQSLSSENKTAQEILSTLVDIRSLRHDIGHTIASLSMTGKLGASFYDAHSSGESYSHPIAVFEEMHALLWDKGEFNFLQNILKDDMAGASDADIRQKIQTVASKSHRNTPAHAQNVKELMELFETAYPGRDLEEWRQKDSVDFLASLNDTFYLWANSYADEAGAETQRKDFVVWTKRLREMRDRYPQYLESISHISTDREGIVTNLALWNEYQRIVGSYLKK